MSLQSEFAEIAARDGRAALVTVIAGGELGAKLLDLAPDHWPRELGQCGLHRAGGWDYLVCRYAPAGNILGRPVF